MILWNEINWCYFSYFWEPVIIVGLSAYPSSPIGPFLFLDAIWVEHQAVWLFVCVRLHACAVIYTQTLCYFVILLPFWSNILDFSQHHRWGNLLYFGHLLVSWHTLEKTMTFSNIKRWICTLSTKHQYNGFIFQKLNMILQVEEGKLKGISKKSLTGKCYHAFLGIPYAKPPVGKLRFRVSSIYNIKLGA